MRYAFMVCLVALAACSAKYGVVELEGDGRAVTAASLTQFLVYVDADGSVSGRVIDDEGNVVTWNDKPLEFELSKGADKGWLKTWGADWRELTPDEVAQIRALAGWPPAGE